MKNPLAPRDVIALIRKAIANLKDSLNKTQAYRANLGADIGLCFYYEYTHSQPTFVEDYLLPFKPVYACAGSFWFSIGDDGNRGRIQMLIHALNHYEKLNQAPC